MKTRSRLICLGPLASLFLALAIAPGLGAPAATATEPSASAIKQAVLETNAAMMAAANQLDTATFFSYIVDGEYPPVVQNGVIFRTRQAAKDAVDRGLRTITKIERRIDHPEVTVLGPDSALLVGRGTVAATDAEGRTMTGEFSVSLIFVRRDSTWKVLHGHYSTPPRM